MPQLDNTADQYTVRCEELKYIPSILKAATPRDDNQGLSTMVLPTPQSQRYTLMREGGNDVLDGRLGGDSKCWTTSALVLVVDEGYTTARGLKGGWLRCDAMGGEHQRRSNWRDKGR